MRNKALKQLTIRAEACRPAKGGGFILSGSTVALELLLAPRCFLVHGWQSWSLTAWLETSRRMPAMQPALMRPMQTDPVHVDDERLNGSWYGAVEMDDGQVVFLGALGLDSHVALEGDSLKGWYEISGGEWFLATGDEQQIMTHYAELLKERFGKGRVRKPHHVWCSWYSLYTEIYEQQLFKILADLDDLPFDVFQIDDGWQKKVGDWEPNDKFPSGMQAMADQIRATGRIPGLWLAPLLVVPSSSLYRQHRDWLLHDQQGRLVSAGFNWGEPLFALDTTHPQALDWLEALMKKVRVWGYDYAKLDFLYAGALPGQRHADMPREAALRNGLKVIRQALGKAYFLTCGTPILPSLGLCDGMRIGPDVADYWITNRDDNLLQNFAIPGARNALRTSLNRLWLQPLVHTDPDVVYFRSTQNELTAEQKALLQELAQVAGFKASSDVPAWLTEAERAALRQFLASRPRVQKVDRYCYKIGKRQVDFGPFLELPSRPGFPKSFEGALLGGLANLPLLMKLFDAAYRRSLRKVLRKNPV